MWATVMYSQATNHPTTATLRRIARCYKSWITDRDTDVVQKLIAVLLEKHALTNNIMTFKIHCVLKNIQSGPKKRQLSET